MIPIIRSWIGKPGGNGPGFAFRTAVIGVIVLMLHATAALAQDDGDELDFSPPRIGLLLQTDFYAESLLFEEGFIVRTSRLSVSGKVGDRFRYFVQANLLTNRAILDTRLGVRLTKALEIEAGLVKSPFSTEFLRSRASLPLAERSRVVIMLAPKRQIGATAIVNVGATSLHAGVYNGNGQFDLVNDGPGFMTVGRVDHRIAFDEGRGGRGGIRFALNAAYSRDHAAFIPGLFSAFAGTRLLGSADIEIGVGPFLAAAEIIAARLHPEADAESETNTNPEPDSGSDLNPWGFSLTGGWEVVSQHRIVGRIDFLTSDQDQPNADQFDLTNTGDYWLVAGYSFQPIPYAQFSLEYRYDVTNKRTSAIVGRFQLARK